MYNVASLLCLYMWHYLLRSKLHALRCHCDYALQIQNLFSSYQIARIWIVLPLSCIDSTEISQNPTGHRFHTFKDAN